MKITVKVENIELTYQEDHYKTGEDLYKCLLDIVEAESWEEAHDLAEDMLNKYYDRFDVIEEEK